MKHSRLEKNQRLVSITSSDALFDEIHYLLVASREAQYKRCSCVILSAILSSFLCERVGRVLIVDSANHSVVFDGNDTWDLSLGVVFRDYEYPSIDLPKPEFIPAFQDFFKVSEFDRLYSVEGLTEAIKKVTIKEVSFL